MLTIIQLVYSQNMTKSETIHYINNSLQRNTVSVDNQGIITISKIGTFYYKDIELGGYPFHQFQVQFKCINNNECIDNPDFNPSYDTKYSNLVRLYFNDKDQYLKILHAFDYLFKKLRAENATKSNNDPFSSENYKK